MLLQVLLSSSTTRIVGIGASQREGFRLNRPWDIVVGCECAAGVPATTSRTPGSSSTNPSHTVPVSSLEEHRANSATIDELPGVLPPIVVDRCFHRQEQCSQRKGFGQISGHRGHRALSFVETRIGGTGDNYDRGGRNPLL